MEPPRSVLELQCQIVRQPSRNRDPSGLHRVLAMNRARRGKVPDRREQNGQNVISWLSTRPHGSRRGLRRGNAFCHRTWVLVEHDGPEQTHRRRATFKRQAQRTFCLYRFDVDGQDTYAQLARVVTHAQLGRDDGLIASFRFVASSTIATSLS